MPASKTARITKTTTWEIPEEFLDQTEELEANGDFDDELDDEFDDDDDDGDDDDEP